MAGSRFPESIWRDRRRAPPQRERGERGREMEWDTGREREREREGWSEAERERDGVTESAVQTGTRRLALLSSMCYLSGSGVTATVLPD